MRVLGRPDRLETALLERAGKLRRRHRIIGKEHRAAEMHTALPCSRLYSCLVRSKGPLLRPDLTPTRTAAAGRGKDRRRRPASAGAQRPCGGPTLQSRSLKEGPLPDLLNNVRENDS